MLIVVYGGIAVIDIDIYLYLHREFVLNVDP